MFVFIWLFKNCFCSFVNFCVFFALSIIIIISCLFYKVGEEERAWSWVNGEHLWRTLAGETVMRIYYMKIFPNMFLIIPTSLPI